MIFEFKNVTQMILLYNYNKGLGNVQSFPRLHLCD